MPVRLASRFIVLSVMAALAVMGLATAGALGVGTSGSRAGPNRPATTTPLPAGLRSEAAAATSAFRSTTTGDASRLVGDVDLIAADVAAGDVTDARSAELTAQADFDEVRVDAASPQNVASMDDLAGQVPPGSTFGGLHAVERDLWSTGEAVADLPSLRAQAAVTASVVSRQSLSPSAIVTGAVGELDLVVDEALPARQELYSHRDDVDVAAGVAAAGQALAAVRPLACSVDPGGCATASTDLATLASEVAALGPPVAVPDTALTPSVERRLSQQTDTTADALAALEDPLLPFGTNGPEPYGAASPVASGS